MALTSSYLFIQFSSILVQFWQRLVAVLEELGLGLHHWQHLTGSINKDSYIHLFNTSPSTNPATTKNCPVRHKDTVQTQYINKNKKWTWIRSTWTHCWQNVRLLLGLNDINLKQKEAVVSETSCLLHNQKFSGQLNCCEPQPQAWRGFPRQNLLSFKTAKTKL